MESQGKPAISSLTINSAFLMVFFWALPMLLHAAGLKNSQDVTDVVQAAHQLAVPIGALMAVYGRIRAKQPITGIVTASNDPPY